MTAREASGTKRLAVPKPALRITISIVLLAAVCAVVLGRDDTPELVAALRHLPVLVVILAVGALAAGALLAAVRLRYVADDLGYPLGWRDSMAALGLGQLGGALFFQIAGQLTARGAYLSRRGLPVGATVLMVGYERLLGTLVSLALAAVGAWYIFGRIALDIEGGGDALIKIAVGVFLAVAASAWLGWGRVAVTRGAALIAGNPLRGLLRIAVLSLAVQLMTASGYIVLVRGLAPQVPVVDVAAATVVVMFAAALPISLAGWGVRELSAIVALGAVGVPAGAALIAAAVVGVASLLVVLPLGALALTAPPDIRPPAAPAGIGIDYARLVNLFVPLAAAIAVFFNLHLPTEAGGLNVNLADPLALLGGVLFLLFAVWQPRAWPDWRLPGFNFHALLATFMLTVSLLLGAARFGWTDWALTNKYLGWYVLLAYGATGALLAKTAGKNGAWLLLQTFAAAGLAVAGLELCLEFLRSAGVDLSDRVLAYNANGFAANRNAFAFQMLMTGAAVIVLGFRGRAAALSLATILAALWFAASRAGWITFAILLLLSVYVRALSWRQVASAVLYGAALAFAIENAWVLQLLHGESVDAVLKRVAARPNMIPISESTMSERLKSYRGAWELFRAHPLFGAGLGNHIEESLRRTGTPLVIHSTPFWIAAEIGLVGLAVFAAPVLRIFHREIGRARRDPTARLLVLTIAVFGSMSLVHEMLYQRTFWLLLGAGLAWLASGGETQDAQGRQ